MIKYAWIISINLCLGILLVGNSFGDDSIKFVTYDGGKLILDKYSVTKVTISRQNNITCFLSVFLNGESATKFSKLTGENIGKPMQLLLNDVQISAPIIREKIVGRQLIITASSCREAETIREAIQN